MSRLVDADKLVWSIPPEEYIARCIVANAPTVEVPTWIPCSERLPESDEYVIITILDERGDAPYRYADFGWYLDAANCWIVDDEQRTDVIAWMPLPRAFKEKI